MSNFLFAALTAVTVAGCYTALGTAEVAKKTEPVSYRAEEKRPDLVVAEYDRFEHETRWALGSPIKVHAAGSAVFSLNTSFTCPGDHAPCEPTVILSFVTTGIDWKLLKYRDLYFLVDGERMKLGEVAYEGEPGASLVYEWAGITLTPQTFVEIARGESVEGRLGQYEFILPSFSREGMRKLADEVEAMLKQVPDHEATPDTPEEEPAKKI